MTMRFLMLGWHLATIFLFSFGKSLKTDDLLFFETFDENDGKDLFSSKWIKSSVKDYKDQPLLAKAATTTIKGLDVDKGLSLSQANRHYGVSTKFSTPFDTKGRKEFVVQYDLKLENGLQCGGAYIKLLRDSPELDLSQLNGSTPYTIMFGPDKCGPNDRVHFIIQHQNPVSKEWEEKHINSTLNTKSDKGRSHLYTLVLKDNNDFEIYVDKRLGKKGNLLTHMLPPVNPPETIDDPTDKKPSDWVDMETMDDPDAKKPDDWDQPKMVENTNAHKPKGWLDHEPERIHDPKATKPEGWDDEEDGVWEAPLVDNPACTVGCGEWKRPMMNNPAYKGPWRPPKIPNPKYKGLWQARQLPHPHHFFDPSPYDSLAPMGALAVEVWTTDAGILFDNFVIAPSLKAAFRFADDTYVLKDAMEAKQAETEKREEERIKKKKEIDARLSKGGWWTRIEVVLEDFAELVMANLTVSMATLAAVMFGGTVFIVSAFSRKGKGRGQGRGVAEGLSQGLEEDEDEGEGEGEGEDVALDEDQDKEESKGGGEVEMEGRDEGKGIKRRGGKKESKLGQEDEDVDEDDE